MIFYQNVPWIAQQQNTHPYIQYSSCRVSSQRNHQPRTLKKNHYKKSNKGKNHQRCQSNLEKLPTGKDFRCGDISIGQNKVEDPYPIPRFTSIEGHNDSVDQFMKGNWCGD
jgi:hypothetical protein